MSALSRPHRLARFRIPALQAGGIGSNPIGAILTEMEQAEEKKMSIPKTLYEENPEMGWTILLGYRGSFVHGTYIPKNDPDSIDDIDVQGICIPPISYYYGLDQFGSRGTKEIKKDEWDIVLFEFTKAIRLLEQGNPNILQILWLNSNHYIQILPEGQLLLDNRELFVGKHSYHSFVGYAHGQLHRMTHSVCKGYMGRKRKELVEKFGYDTKNAAHLIRILRMGIEFLNEGRLYPTRSDAAQLKEIKRGEWSLKQVQEEAGVLFSAAQLAYIRSDLPAKPDRKKLTELCTAITNVHLTKKIGR